MAPPPPLLPTPPAGRQSETAQVISRSLGAIGVDLATGNTNVANGGSLRGAAHRGVAALTFAVGVSPALVIVPDVGGGVTDLNPAGGEGRQLGARLIEAALGPFDRESVERERDGRFGLATGDDEVADAISDKSVQVVVRLTA